VRVLEALERNDEYEGWWDHTWEWQYDDAPVLGLDTPELRARLERVRPKSEPELLRGAMDPVVQEGMLAPHHPARREASAQDSS